MQVTKWTIDRLTEMETWKRINKATVSQTAQQFKVDASKYGSARAYNISTGRLSIKGQRKSPVKQVATGKVLNLEIPDVAPQAGKVVVMIVPSGELRSVIGALWE